MSFFTTIRRSDVKTPRMRFTLTTFSLRSLALQCRRYARSIMRTAEPALLIRTGWAHKEAWIMPCQICCSLRGPRPLPKKRGDSRRTRDPYTFCFCLWAVVAHISFTMFCLRSMHQLVQQRVQYQRLDLRHYKLGSTLLLGETWTTSQTLENCIYCEINSIIAR